MLLPPLVSTMTLLARVKTSCMVSRYRRSRMTWGAFSYSLRMDEKREALPCASPITLAL
ncbi:Uncharacterised protein [Bordetella pertussis]|nr:Uncharacterised protein [Bordetella pertussis]CFO83746.1 Uncharacterised protein [Bordetella pertussis]CFU95386.1 Uncharacterised protein [Bordetella pertussis]CPJ00771.1 Uncharacterised protein [Bordetella pertussis]CPL35530.1 Uncharacterised protein [Bordetella pertussis]